MYPIIVGYIFSVSHIFQLYITHVTATTSLCPRNKENKGFAVFFTILLIIRLKECRFITLTQKIN
jgi:hypothetical protein